MKCIDKSFVTLVQQLLPKDKRTSSEFPKRGRNSVTELVDIKTHEINIMEIIAKDGIVIQNIMHLNKVRQTSP